MVVDHVKSYCESVAMSGVDQLLLSARPAVIILRRKWLYSVITPVARAGTLRHRHQLNSGDSQVAPARQMRNQRLKSPFRGVRSDMHFVEHTSFRLFALPAPI